MAADIKSFELALDETYREFASQQVSIDTKALKGLSERGAIHAIEKQFQMQLQRARSAFLQEFRNRSVVVETEVAKIREELTAKFDAMYAEKIGSLRRETAEAVRTAEKYKDDILQLRSLATAQEACLAAVRHRWGPEQREKLRAEIDQLRQELETCKEENSDISHQLVCSDQLIIQLRNDLSATREELAQRSRVAEEERRVYDERLKGLRDEMQAQQDLFSEQLCEYDRSFREFRERTEAELQITDILSQRRLEALRNMEHERELHRQARTKPSARIGEAEERFVPYEPAKGTRYRVDDMGMDTSWRDYQLSDPCPAPKSKRKQVPRFRVERVRRSAAPGANAPVPTETPRTEGAPQLPAVVPVLGNTPR